MAKKQEKRRAKKWSKIWVLNWVTITTFFISLIAISVERFAMNIRDFDLVDLHTWDTFHCLGVICGMYLLLESIALLKSKNIDVIESLKEVKDTMEDKPK